LAIADENLGAAITAIEIHPHRARLMRKLFRDDAGRIRMLTADARHLPFTQAFDCILVDAPCSGTGTLARNPEIKWRLRADDLAELHDRQLAILRSTVQHLKPGSRLVYSTCSLENEENEDVVEQLLTDNPQLHSRDCHEELNRLKAAGILSWPDSIPLTRGPYLRTIPGVHPCDGFFAALLERE
jgi:16S rRNA (cytosine967-C5)-methyltransferase